MEISVYAVKEMLEKGVVMHLIDVRTKPEYHSERIELESVRNHPLDDIESIDAGKDEKLYLICQTGKRSRQAQQRLLAAGFVEVVSVDGGLNAWKTAKFPCTKTRGTFPIMQQVQLATGSLVLFGALGSVLLNTGWAWLAVFVGAGLTVAGATGFCGMALLMARMPWNKIMQTEA